MHGKIPAPAQWRIFFDSLSNAESITTALRKSDIPRTTAYHYKKHDRIINERWEEAILAGTDTLKDAARERAVDGVTSVHEQYYRGELVARHVETKYSDKLLLALLQSRDPSFRQTASDQVQARLIQELTRVVDVLQKRLPPDVYEMVVEILATDDVNSSNSQEAPRYLESGPSDNT